MLDIKAKSKQEGLRDTDVLHGFIFSLFFPHWLEAKGAKSTFLAIGKFSHTV